MLPRNRKRILFFTENYERGGGNRYLYDMICIAKQAGNDVELISNEYGLDSVEQKWFSDLGVNYSTIRLFSWGELRAKYRLRSHFIKKLIARMIFLPVSIFIRFYQQILFLRVLKEKKPDLIVGANGGYPAGGAVNRFILAGYFCKTPAYYSIVNVPSQNPWDKCRMQFWDRLLPRISKKIIVDSKEIEQQLIPHHFDSKKITILYNGLKDTIDYQQRKNTRTKILFFARMEEVKGIPFLTQAIRSLKPEIMKSCDFHFYGDGTLSPLIKKLASDFKENVFFHGFFEGNFQPIFCEADIYILPSLMEGLPYTIIEAMKTGCCILASNVGGLPELVDHMQSGFLVEPGNTVKLAEALEKLILSPELREKMGRAAKEKFDHEFEQSAIFRQHSGLFDL